MVSIVVAVVVAVAVVVVVVDAKAVEEEEAAAACGCLPTTAISALDPVAKPLEWKRQEGGAPALVPPPNMIIISRTEIMICLGVFLDL